MNITTFRSFFSRLAVVSVFATASLVLSSSAHAASLPIGGFQQPVPNESGDLVGATLVTSTGPVGFVSDLFNFSGTLTTNVYTQDMANPYGLNKVSFEYILTNDVTSVGHHLSELSLNGFGVYLSDVSYIPVLGNTNPHATDRTNGDSIGFSFVQSPIGPGKIVNGASSSRLVVQTDATSFTSSVAAIENGDIAHSLILAPVPEPGTIGLAVAGLIGLGLVARRRKAN
jgi:hypothetical protein